MDHEEALNLILANCCIADTHGLFEKEIEIDLCCATAVVRAKLLEREPGTNPPYQYEVLSVTIK